jgi:NAD-dependent histone deacetylase SIR2
LFDASVYRDADSTSSFHQMVRELSELSDSKTPTLFHNMLSKLADEDRLLRLYTQNVDGLEMKTKSLQTTVPLNRKGPWPKTIQLHGGLQKMVCTKCNDMLDLDADLFDGPTPPFCEQCRAVDNARTEYAGKRSHGIGRLRPRMVLYNEHNPDDEAIGAVVKADLRTRPDALIVVGTTLKIPGVKRIVKEMGAIIRGRRDGLNVWINMDDPPVHKDYEWDIVVRGPCDRVAREAETRIWDAPSQSISEEETDRLVASQSVEVHVLSTPSRTKAEKSIPTPISSRQSSNPPAFKPSKVKALDFKKEQGKDQKKKPGPKPGYKRVPKTKVTVQGIAKKGKKQTVVVKNSTLSFTASKTAVREGKKRKPLGDDDSSSTSSDGKENSPPPTILIKNDPDQGVRPLSPISETRSTSPTSGDSNSGLSPKHSLHFIMN